MCEVESLTCVLFLAGCRGGDPQALGVRGADTEVGAMGAGPRAPDRATVGADYISTDPGAGKNAERARAQAGVEIEGRNFKP